MIAILEYIIKSGVALSLFYFFYWVFLRNDTHLKLNRIILNASLLLSLILPLIQIQISRPEPVLPFFYMDLDMETDSATVLAGNSATSGINILKVVAWVYAAGASLVLLRLLYQGIYLQALSRLSKSEKHSDFTLVYMEKDIIPFSYFNKIFIPFSHTASHEIKSIIDHERSHLRQLHFLDLFLAEFVTIIQWFNPFAWLYERSVKEIHEYLADKAVLDQGYNQGSYQALLVNQAMGGPVFTITSQFNQSLIKKRIVMMTKMKSPRLSQLKSFMLLPLIAMLLMAYNRPEKSVSSFNGTNSSETDGSLKITGKVENAETGLSMEGVAVIVKGTTTGTLTDGTGGFVITVPDKESVLVFSSIGFKTQAIPVKGEDNIRVKMEGNVFQIDFSGPNSLVASDKPASNPADGEDKYVIIEELPGYPGGTDALKKFIAGNIRFPQDAKRQSISGIVQVTFIINKEGKILKPQVTKSVFPSIDEEALRVIGLINGWKPAMQNGKPVACKVTVPVQFSL